jgi:hypothetical protein
LHEDTRPSFYVNPRKNLFYCHGWGQGGDLIRFVQLSQQLSFRQSLAYLQEQLAPSAQLLEHTAAFFDGVLRAFEETWHLGHEFRLIARQDRAIAWLAGEDGTWKAKIGVRIEFAKGRGHSGPTMGADYNRLSELAHPTRTAAENSLAICMVRHGIEGAKEQLAEQPKMKDSTDVFCV